MFLHEWPRKPGGSLRCIFFINTSEFAFTAYSVIFVLMPHERLRHLQEPFEKLIKHARIVGILGHRQVGKTTFLKRNAREYFTLDDEETLLEATASPKKFIHRMKGKRSGIDECQLVPGLFAALKVRVGTSRIPGRFILTGSVRFTSRRAIRESLTGRISNLELYPFAVTEIQKERSSSFIANALGATRWEPLVAEADRAQSFYNERTKTVERYLECGGLPGLFHIRDGSIRKNLLRDIIETILDRDLRLVYRTSLPYQRIYEYCKAIAVAPLQVVRPGSMKRSIRIAETTQQHLLSALESVFLLRRIPIEGDYKGDLFWFEDQCERGHFIGTNQQDEADWITFIYRNVRTQFNYRLGEQAQFFHYRTRGGAEVPLAIRTQAGVLGIIGIASRTAVNLSLRRSAESFLRRYNHSKVLFVTREGHVAEVLTDRIAVFSAQAALF